MLCITGSAIVFGATCILLMLGVQVQKQSLMIPYLIVQMLMIVMTGSVGIHVAVGLLFLNHLLYGLSVTTAVFFTSILPIFFWFTVKRAYTDTAKTGKLSKDRNQSNLECRYVKKFFYTYLKIFILTFLSINSKYCGSGYHGTLEMGYCFFCVPLLEGILVHGFLSLLICIVVFFSTAYDDNALNPFCHFLNHITTALEESIDIESIVSKDTINILKDHASVMFNLATTGVIAYIISCFMMIIGTQFKKLQKHPWLMIPYLIAQMSWIVIDIMIGIPLAVILFYLNHSKDGQIVTSFVLLTSIMSFYFWMTVNTAYKKLEENNKSRISLQMELMPIGERYSKASNSPQNDEYDFSDKASKE